MFRVMIGDFAETLKRETKGKPSMTSSRQNPLLFARFLSPGEVGEVGGEVGTVESASSETTAFFLDNKRDIN